MFRRCVRPVVGFVVVALLANLAAMAVLGACPCDELRIDYDNKRVVAALAESQYKYYQGICDGDIEVRDKAISDSVRHGSLSLVAILGGLKLPAMTNAVSLIEDLVDLWSAGWDSFDSCKAAEISKELASETARWRNAAQLAWGYCNVGYKPSRSTSRTKKTATPSWHGPKRRAGLSYSRRRPMRSLL